MRYIKTPDIYPYSLRQLRQDNPNVSFPVDIPEDTLAEYGVYPVAETAPPTPGSTQVREETAPIQVNGVWTQQWAVRDMTTEELQARVPKAVTARQAEQALILAGLYDLVEPAIDAIPDATQRALIRSEWRRSQVFERNRPALIGLATALGLNSEQLDDLFITAANLP